jgi:SseB protein C-terminal domain
VVALSRFYATKLQVKRAWIAHYHTADSAQGQGRLLVALDLKDASTLEALAGEGSILVKAYVQKPQHVDFVQYKGIGLAQYFIAKRPFYIKGNPISRLLAKFK